MKPRWPLSLLCLFFCTLETLPAQTVTNGRTWHYTLLGSSTFIDDCLICGRPTILQPLRGSFDLLLLEEGPLFTRYLLTNISFYAGPRTNPLYSVRGSGTYQVGGEVALQQEMRLEVQVKTEFTNRAHVFTNKSRSVSRTFPLIESEVEQSEMDFVQFFSMHLLAAPAREIWFSTRNSFTSNSSTNRGQPSDLLAQSGRIVRTGATLFQAAGINSPPTGLGIDAFEIGPGGEVLFSLNQGVTNSTLGNIQEGDLLSDAGRIAQRNQGLTAAFGIQPVVPDLGLDAVHLSTQGEILFSIRANGFSERLGIMLRHGDVLSNSGQVVKSNQQLLSRFQPAAPSPSQDYGLDALYLWPSGEFWFSTQTGFQDQGLGSIQEGDLLSDQGVIVFRNLDLLSEFAPAEDLADFGLDGLFVVTDTVEPAPAALFGVPRIQQGLLNLSWQGMGRVFQVEKASRVKGPYQSIGNASLERQFSDTVTGQQGYYRVRQW